MVGALAVALLLADRRLGLIAALSIPLTAASAISTGKYTSHEVVAGLLIGATIATTGFALCIDRITRLTATLTTTRLRGLVADPAHTTHRNRTQ